jgi:hypothetical protein
MLAMSGANVAQECCENFLLNASPQSPPTLPRRGQRFSEWQRCTCGTNLKIVFEATLMIGNDSPQYSAVEISETKK